MKNKITHYFVVVVILSFLLGSCLSTPTQLPVTITITPTTTMTDAPTMTNTPATTPSPTQTPDPNRPSDATGRDVGGYYKEVQEDGKTIRYYWVDFSDENYAPIDIKGWFASHVLNGSLNKDIPLIDQEADGFNKNIPLYFEAQDGLQLPYLRHQQNPYSTEAPSFTRILSTKLVEWHFEKSFSAIVRDIPLEDYQTYVYNLQDGKIPFVFSTPIDDYIWKLGPTIGYKFYAIKWEDADPVIHPEFWESRDKSKRENLIFRWTVFTDANGVLIAISAVKEPEKLSDEEFLGWILNPLATILENNQLSIENTYWSSTDGSLVKSGLTSGSKNFVMEGGMPMVDTVIPHFEIVHNP